MPRRPWPGAAGIRRGWNGPRRTRGRVGRPSEARRRPRPGRLDPSRSCRNHGQSRARDSGAVPRGSRRTRPPCPLVLPGIGRCYSVPRQTPASSPGRGGSGPSRHPVAPPSRGHYRGREPGPGCPASGPASRSQIGLPPPDRRVGMEEERGQLGVEPEIVRVPPQREPQDRLRLLRLTEGPQHAPDAAEGDRREPIDVAAAGRGLSRPGCPPRHRCPDHPPRRVGIDRVGQPQQPLREARLRLATTSPRRSPPGTVRRGRPSAPRAPPARARLRRPNRTPGTPPGIPAPSPPGIPTPAARRRSPPGHPR